MANFGCHSDCKEGGTVEFNGQVTGLLGLVLHWTVLHNEELFSSGANSAPIEK